MDSKQRWQQAPSRRTRAEVLLENISTPKLRNLYRQFKREGIGMELFRPPPLYHRPNKIMPPEPVVLEAVKHMLDNHWIREIKNPSQDPGLYAKLKVVKKKTGKIRCTLACCELNKYTVKRHFKSDDLRTLKPLLKPGMYMGLLDIADAFYSKSQRLNPKWRRYVRFAVGTPAAYRAYEFLVTPQGWSSSPRALHIMLQPVTQAINALGILHARATDDIIILHMMKHVCNQQLEQVRKILTDRSFVVKKEKTKYAAQKQVWYGAQIETTPTVYLSVSKDKQRDFRRAAKYTLKLNFEMKLTPRNAAGFIGKIRSAILYLHCAFAHTVHLATAQRMALAASDQNWDKPFKLPEPAIAELYFYLQHAEFKGRHVESYLIEIRMINDASNSGYGGKIQQAPTEILNRCQRANIGFWIKTELTWHINVKELNGAMRLVRTTLTPATDQIRSMNQVFHVNILLDNTVAISGFNKQGSNDPLMSSMIIEFMDWCSSHFLPSKLVVTATYLPGTRMIEMGGDELSRMGRLGEEIRLNPSIFKSLCRILNFHPDLDLFATRYNTQLKRFCSPTHDLQATATNAMSIKWHHNAYAFPPLKMIPSLLTKIERDQARLLVVLPLTPSSKWWPLMLSMVASDPIHIQQGKATFQTPNKYLQPLKQWSNWSWIGIVLSSSNSNEARNWRARTRRKWLRSSGRRVPNQGIKSTGKPFTLSSRRSTVTTRLSDLSLSAALRRG